MSSVNNTPELTQNNPEYCPEFEGLMADALFGDISVEQRDQLDAHLSECTACREEFVALEGTIELSRMRSHADPGEAFWDGFHDRVIGRVLEEASSPTNALPLTHDRDAAGRRLSDRDALPRRSGGGLRLLSPLTSRLVAAIVLIAVGYGIGKLASVPAPSGSQLAVQEVQSDVQSGGDAGGDGTAGATGAADYLLTGQSADELLAQSEIVLLQFVNGASTTSGSQQARELGRRAEIVRTSLEDDGDRRMSELVRELEFVLLQIANLDATADEPGVELVRNAIDRRALLFRIDREQLGRPRGQAERPGPGGQI